MKKPFKNTVGMIVVGTIICATLLLLWKPWSSAEKNADEQPPAKGEANVVKVTEEKLRNVKVETQPAEVKPMQRMITVDGRIQYDDTRHVEIKIPSNGIIVELKVKPGDLVHAGDVLGVASSPEIGEARANVIRLQMELELQKERHVHIAEIYHGVTRVTEGIEKGESLEELKKATVNTNLEEFHERLFGNYSKLLLARKLVQELSKADNSGAIPARTRTERSANLESSEAAVNGAIELSRHESYLRMRQSELLTAQAQRQLELAQQHLRSLLGVGKGKPAEGVTTDPSELALLEFRAPFDGTVEQKGFGVTERVKAGDMVFVVADASHLWVSASIREQEWQATRLSPGQQIRISIPALKSASRLATINYIGREVQTQNNSVPLIATIDNAEADLRPGLFVNVHLPMAIEEVLVVPEPAVMMHEGATFVFVQLDATHFKRIDVKVGASENGLIEIVEGLQSGTRVVTQGTFFLKSELLLIREE